MSQNESTTFLVTDAKNLTLIDATRENSPWCPHLVLSSRSICKEFVFLVSWFNIVSHRKFKDPAFQLEGYDNNILAIHRRFVCISQG